MSDRPSVYLDQPDPLSSVLNRLQLNAEVYVHGDFCGRWAVDTSGSRRMPFHLISRGEAWLHFEGREQLRMSTGDLVLFPHDSKHVLSSTEQPPNPDAVNANMAPEADESTATRLICGFFEFQSSVVSPLLDSISPVVVMDLSDMSETPMARTLVEAMIQELQQAEPGYYSSINQLACLLFVQVVRQQIRSGLTGDGLLSAMFDPQVGRALRVIHSEPEQRWTLVSLAQQANMGRSSFAKRFLELVGMPAMQYLTHWRMQEAQRWLLESSLSLWEIAERCGYESEAAFRKAFKKTVGQTPGQIRRRAEV